MNSRERLSLVVLLLVPLLAFGYAIVHEFGTAEDFARLNIVGPDGGALLAQAPNGLVHSALLETSFLHASSVGDLLWIRALTLILAALTGVAIWQLLERGGWAEFDAAAAGACVSLLPSMQVMVGWATSWPILLAGLLSLAGFAAIESELERGGLKRVVGLVGGTLLYLTSSLVHFPSAVMGVVPLAGVLLVRQKRVWLEHQKWLLLHVGTLLVGIVGGWMIERRLLEDVGLLASVKSVDFGLRLKGFFVTALPAGGSAFLPHWLVPGGAILAWLGLLGVGALLWLAIKKETVENDTAPEKWTRSLGIPLGLILVAVLMAPDWQGGYRLFLPLAALATVSVIVALRVVVAPSKKTLPYFYAGLGVLVALCAISGGYRLQTQIAEPLTQEWERVHAAVGRANLKEKATILIITPNGGNAEAAGADFSAWRQPATAERMARTALSERFGEQLAKRKIEVVLAPAPQPGAKYDLVLDHSSAPR